MRSTNVKVPFILEKKKEMSLITVTDQEALAEAERKGAQIYHKNRSIQGLANLYYHPLMQEWIKENGHSWEDWKQLVLYLETFKSIQDYFKENFKREPSPFETVFYFQQVLSQGDSRRMIMEQFKKMEKGEIKSLSEVPKTIGPRVSDSAEPLEWHQETRQPDSIHVDLKALALRTRAMDSTPDLRTSDSQGTETTPHGPEAIQ